MTTLRHTLRRTLLPLAVAVAALVGLDATVAQAAFTDTTSLTASIGTLSVAAPTAITTTGTYCDTYTLHAKVSWKASTTTRGVTGYTITALAANGSPVATFEVGTSTTMSYDVDRSYASQGIKVTLTTTTSYGWTATSAPSAALTC